MTLSESNNGLAKQLKAVAGLLVAILLVQFVIGYFTVRSGLRTPSTTFEYRIEFHTDAAPTPLTRQLNAWGSESWELLSVRRARSGDGESGEWGSEVVLRRAQHH